MIIARLKTRSNAAAAAVAPLSSHHIRRKLLPINRNYEQLSRTVEHTCSSSNNSNSISKSLTKRLYERPARAAPHAHTHDHIAIILVGSGLENFAAYAHRIHRLVRITQTKSK